MLLLADTWATLALGMIGPIYALFVADIGGSILEASWAYFAMTFASGIMMYVFGKLEDKIEDKESMVVIGFFLCSVGCLSYFFVHDFITLIVTQVILGVSEAVLIPAYDALYSKYLENDKAASQWGDWEAMRFMITAIGAVTGGFIAKTFGFKALFLVMAGVSLISIAVAVHLKKEKDLDTIISNKF